MAVCPFHAESLTMAQRFAGPWSRPRPTRGPMGQPAYSQFVTQAASARGWFFAKIAEPATNTHHGDAAAQRLIARVGPPISRWGMFPTTDPASPQAAVRGPS